MCTAGTIFRRCTCPVPSFAHAHTSIAATVARNSRIGVVGRLSSTRGRSLPHLRAIMRLFVAPTTITKLRHCEPRAACLKLRAKHNEQRLLSLSFMFTVAVSLIYSPKACRPVIRPRLSGMKLSKTRSSYSWLIASSAANRRISALLVTWIGCSLSKSELPSTKTKYNVVLPSYTNEHKILLAVPSAVAIMIPVTARAPPNCVVPFTLSWKIVSSRPPSETLYATRGKPCTAGLNLMLKLQYLLQ